MIYIKLDENRDLVMTVSEPIYLGDNLNQKIVYLIPLQVGEIDMKAAIPYLSYIRTDGVVDIVRLDKKEGTYKDAYYQYELPVSCKLSECPGDICTWMQIFAGTPSNPTIAKSGECVLHVNNSKNMDDYVCDHHLSAMYAMQKQIDAAENDMASMRETMATKGDNLIYDSDKQELQLSSEGTLVGDAVDMSTMVNDDAVIHFSEADKG